MRSHRPWTGILVSCLLTGACVGAEVDADGAPSVASRTSSDAAAAPSQTPPAPQDPVELLLTNARIVDGTGAPAFVGDVGIIDGRIVAVGPSGSIEARDDAVVDDLSGMILTPGFIDIHNHSDSAILRTPSAEPLLAQGLTTIVVGADGGSRWPIGEYLDEVDAAEPAVNVATTVGHGTVRRRVLGDDQARAATADEIGAMKDLVRQAIQEGAFGLSSGLEYDPGRHSTTGELIALAGAAGEHGGFYISHMRDEELYVMEAVDEVIEIGRQAAVPVQISHIKMGDATAWGRSEEALERMRAARAEGIDITADWYPYAASATTLALVVPSRDFEDAAAVAEGLEVRGGANRVQVTRYENDPSIEGLRLDEIAARWQTTAIDAYQRIMRNGGGGMISHSMQLADVNAFAADPLVMVCSDGGIGSSHPRGAGTFPRVLAYYVRDEGILDLETAVRKMTSMPADRLGLDDRGRIAVGAVADVVAFDYDAVQDNSTFEEPELPASGIVRVWVDGELTWNEDGATGTRAGRALRHP